MFSPMLVFELAQMFNLKHSRSSISQLTLWQLLSQIHLPLHLGMIYNKKNNLFSNSFFDWITKLQLPKHLIIQKEPSEI